MYFDDASSSHLPQYRTSSGNVEQVPSDPRLNQYFEQHYQAFLVTNNADKKTRKTKKRKVDSIIAAAKASILDEDEDESVPWSFTSDNEVIKNTASDLSEPAVVSNDARSGIAETATDPVKGVFIQEPTEEDEKWEKVNERKISNILPPRPTRGAAAIEALSTFHGGSELDYQGRSWCKAPAGIRPEDHFGDHECYIPKKCVRKLTGHSKGVQALEIFPGTGHLLLSASLDGKCKVWDIHDSSLASLKRTYVGHDEAVRAINMSATGFNFLSSGFDRYIRHWDLETGQAVATFSNRKMSYSVKYAPRDNNIFLAACSDNRVYQWDIRTGEVCQEYNYHLQPCNTVTFIDEGRKFVSTSDDKKILVWEFGIPVPIKYIAEPDMQCIPSVTIHPSQQFFAGQSMDNSIVVYQCGDKVKQVRKKTFRGHNNSGYACQIGFSPNGKFLVSGDGRGQTYYWDWKSTKCYRKFHAHDGGPCTAAVWHPLSPAMVITCGWDGIVKIWDS